MAEKLKIKLYGSQLAPLLDALRDLADNPLPLMVKAQLNEHRDAVATLQQAWGDAIRPLIQKHTKDQRVTIGSQDEEWPFFAEDPEAQELFAEELHVEIKPLCLCTLNGIEKRLQKRNPPQDLDIDPDHLSLLTHLGFISKGEDLTETETD